MFSTLRKKIQALFEGAVEETEIIIPHGRPYFLQAVRRSVTIISEGADEAATVFRISGTRKQISRLRTLIGEK